jgi:hypothetical protein
VVSGVATCRVGILSPSNYPIGYSIPYAYARYAWTAPAAFIPNKQQVLLDWLFGALLNKKKLKIESGDAVLIWRTINDLVRSNFVRSLAKASQLLALRTSATQVMTDALSAASRQHYGPG